MVFSFDDNVKTVAKLKVVGVGGKRWRASCNISKAALLRGTRCWRFAFIRDAGTVHTDWSKSISDHSAPRTSPLRAAVRIKNLSAKNRALEGADKK